MIGSKHPGDILTQVSPTKSNSGNRLHELAGLARLGQVTHGTGFESLERKSRAQMHSENQDASLPVPFTDPAHSIEPARAWQVQIHYHHIRLKVFVVQIRFIGVVSLGANAKRTLTV